jgi:ABC-type multidrug transport system fused ATPase/permease subunit
MIAIVPGIMLISAVFGRYIRKLSKQAQKKVADSNTIVEETLQGIQSVKVFTNELFEILRYRKRVETIAKTNIKNGKMRGAFSSFIIIGLFGSLIAIIWRGAVLLGQGDLSIGDFISFIMYSVFIGGTFGGFASIFGRIQQFLGASEDLFEIFEETKEDLQINIQESNTSHTDISGQIDINKLNFHYPSRSDIQVLKNVNISIPYNQTTAIVGPSGAGKSTLISLLLRLYEPTEGTIRFNQHLSSNIALSDLRNQIAIVPQDVFLFGGSIRENIAYGNTTADESEIIEASKMANALEFISKFPEGFDTIVGERGTQLSGGQRQRIAIARAILKEPKILILDEATSSLDSESEKLVQEALEKVMKNRTSIIIAHRLSTIRKADNIIVLNHGEVVEQGKHNELLAIEGGLYKGLTELQLDV